MRVVRHPAVLPSVVRRRQSCKQSGFSLIEVLVIIVIIGILAAIAIPVFLNMKENAVEGVLEANQKTLSNVLIYTEATDGLPTIASGTPDQNRNALRNILRDELPGVSNPVSNSNLFLSTAQVGANSSAAVVVAQRSVPMQTAINNQAVNLWPLNSTSQAVRDRYAGTLVIQICQDGYLMYGYPKPNTVFNIQKIPYQ